MTTNSCHVIISDYVIERRMTLLLDEKDFAHQQDSWEDSDSLLRAFDKHPFFAGCKRWSDLDITHFHVLLINMLKICADHPESNSNRVNPMFARLNFLLCSLIHLLQQRSGSVIDMLRLNRIATDDVLYDYSARLEVILTPPKTNLRVVIDNA